MLRSTLLAFRHLGLITLSPRWVLVFHEKNGDITNEMYFKKHDYSVIHFWETQLLCAIFQRNRITLLYISEKLQKLFPKSPASRLPLWSRYQARLWKQIKIIKMDLLFYSSILKWKSYIYKKYLCLSWLCISSS